jgi:nucleoside-diphosphate-sugar epimerase
MKALENKKVIVSGGTGFIGINLVNELLNAGAAVTVIDINEQYVSEFIGEVNFIKADFRDAEAYKAELNECEFYFHLAAKVDLTGKRVEDCAVNYEGISILLEALKGNKKLRRFIFYSTQLVIGVFNEARVLDESEPYKTKTLYGESKISGEKIVVEKCTGYKIPYTIIRPTSVFGPFGKEPYRDYFLTIKKGWYFNIGKADNLISLVYVGNLVGQTLFLATHPGAQNETFMGNDCYPYTMHQFASEVANFWKINLITVPKVIIYPVLYFLGFLKMLHINVPIYLFRLKNIVSSYCYSIKKSINLGYVPKTSFSEPINIALNWYDQMDKAFLEPLAVKNIK